MSSKANDANCRCITEHDGFEPVCLNVDVVMTAIYQYIEDEEYLDDTPTCEYVSLCIYAYSLKLSIRKVPWKSCCIFFKIQVPM